MALLLEISNVSKSLYYYHLSSIPYLEKNKDIVSKIIEIFEKSNKTYGYRRVSAVLKKEYKIVNHKKVLKIMNLLGLKPSIKRRKKYSSYRGDVGKKFDNILSRNFKAFERNIKWFTDVTEFKTSDHKLYFSAILDGYNQEIIGYSISRSPTLELIIESFDEALKNSGANNFEKTILHSDQGWQYQSSIFTDKLSKLGITQSMSRKGNCNDNGLMEGFFGLMKNEMYYNKERRSLTFNDLKAEIEKYIYFYNNIRIKIGLNSCSPVEYRY